MPTEQTTIGRLLVNSVLPRGLRSERAWDKKTLTAVLNRLATEHPEQYRDVTFKLMQVAHHSAYTTGGNSFGPEHLRKSPAVLKSRALLDQQLQGILDDDSLDDAAREQKITQLMGRFSAQQEQTIYDEGVVEKSPLAMQVASGARGSKMNLASLRGSDNLYVDHRGRVIPIPILHSFSEGLSPAEYWAGSYGARKGTMDTKFATQDAGFLSKQLNQIVHRSLVTSVDRETPDDVLRGLPVDTDDDDSEGSLLAQGAAGYRRNTILSPRVLADIRRKGVKRILVRSPAVSGAADGGVYARDAGVREFGRLPAVGENVALTAAQALSEPLSQAQLSSKHSGGVATAASGKAVSGFDRINQLIQTPKTFKGGAAHSTIDGTVQRIDEAPAGGLNITIDNQQHYVGTGFKPLVKRGDKVEAGDVISEGLPDPSVIVQHKGIGEGRRYFIQTFRQAFRDAGIKGHRRNIELLARGLINHVRLTDEYGEFAPDDVVPYSSLEHSWVPRPGHQVVQPRSAVGQYLEAPTLHYSIGTKVRPSMLKDFDDFGVNKLAVHPEPPPFQPEMIRGMANLQHDPDWVTRMFGSGLKGSLLEGAQRGATSDPHGTSFVPGLARAVDFGRKGKVITPASDNRQPPQASVQLSPFLG